MTLHFTYPHARYFQFVLYKAERNTFVSINQDLAGPEFEPDPGSKNPFIVGADRLVEQRDFTIRILGENLPPQRAKNTLYVGREGDELEAVIRIYLPDEGYDGAGWGPAAAPYSGTGLPSYEATLADGTRLSADEVVKRIARPIPGQTKQPLTVDQWEELLHAKNNDPTLNPETAPARNPPHWVKYWTLRYSVLGAFKTPQELAEIPYQGAMEGGGDPSTQYMLIYLSRRFGPVYVMRGKMPTFPNAYKRLAIMPEAQTQYWSIVSCEAPPSGQIADGLTDMQIPLDAEGNYTIVVSRPEDRPKNATIENGVAWMNWGTHGEGLDDPRNRTDWGMLMLRIMANNPSWAQSPEKVSRPGTAEQVMGPYYPRSEYTDKASYEATGLKK